MRRTPFSHLGTLPALAVRILEFLNKHGGMGKRELKQRMHSWLFPDWAQAFTLLLERGLIRLDHQERRRRDCFVVFLTPKAAPREFELREARKPKPAKRHRPRSEWFERHLREWLAD